MTTPCNSFSLHRSAKRSGSIIAALLLTTALTPAAFAGFITPVSVSNGAGNLINGSGLSGGAPYIGVTHTNPANNWGNFAGGLFFSTPLDFNLGGLYDLTAVDIWNYSHEGFDFYRERDTKTINISLSTNGVNYSPFGTITLTSAGAVPEPRQQFSLSGLATHVRLQVTSIYGNPNAHGAEAGLGEVRFEGNSAPEPGTWALIGSGLAVLATTRRKRARA